MFAIFQRKLLKNWLMILGWGSGFGVLGFYLVDMYARFFQQNINLQQLLDAFPKEFLVFFGGDVDLFSPSGFIHMEFFSYMPIILGIMVVSAAASLISKPEEEGSLELVIAQPVSRSGLFWSKFLAMVLSILLILFIIWVGFAFAAEMNDFELTMFDLVLPFISLFSILFLFLNISLFLSMLLPASGSASLLSGFLLIASFFISSLVRIDEDLEKINQFSPMKYYQGGEAVNGLDPQKLLILFGLSAFFIALAWFIFIKRDLRFGGSGGLRLVFNRKDRRLS